MIKSAVTISLVKEAEGGPFVFWHDLAAGCVKAADLGYDAVEVFAPNAAAIPVDELKALTAKQSLESGLAERLTGEIIRLRHKLLEAKESAEAVEREIAENGAEMERARANGSSEIARCQEQCAAVSSVKQLFGSFEADCLDVIAQAEVAHDEAQQQKSQAQKVAARITEELREAEGRLKKAEERRAANKAAIQGVKPLPGVSVPA